MISSATVPNIHLNSKTQIDLIFQAQVMLRSFPFENPSFKGFISAVTHGRGLCPTLRSLQELNHLHPPVKPTTTSPPSNGWDWKTLSRFLLGFWRIFRGRTVSFKESVARDVDIQWINVKPKTPVSLASHLDGVFQDITPIYKRPKMNWVTGGCFHPTHTVDMEAILHHLACIKSCT